jgi:small-conductance mechanosensitive channel
MSSISCCPSFLTKGVCDTEISPAMVLALSIPLVGIAFSLIAHAALKEGSFQQMKEPKMLRKKFVLEMADSIRCVATLVGFVAFGVFSTPIGIFSGSLLALVTICNIYKAAQSYRQIPVERRANKL